MCIGAQTRKSIGRLIKHQALIGRNKHDDYQSDQSRAKPGENASLCFRSALSDRAQPKQQEQTKERDGYKFAESLARIFGKRIPFDADISLPAKEVLELNDHE